MKKKVITIFFAALIVFTSASLGAFASSNYESIKAFFNLGVTIKIDGLPWKAVDKNGNYIYPITYNGTTYLPIRSTGEVLGVEVGWDEANNTIWVGAGAAAAEGRISTVFNVDQKVIVGPIEMHISKVHFDESFSQMGGYGEPLPAVVFDVTIENKSDKTLFWDIDYSTLVLNTKEQIDSSLISSYHRSPFFNGNVIKKTQLAFPIIFSDFEEINELRLFLDLVSDDYGIVAEAQEVIIKLK